MLLNYKVKLDIKASSEPIYYYRPYFSKNGRVFTCVIDDKYGIQVGDRLTVNVEYYDAMELTPKIDSFVEQGYVLIPTVFNLNYIKQVEWDELDENEITVHETRHDYYYLNEFGLLEVVEYKEKLSDDELILSKNIPYFIEDGKLLFEGLEYDVLFDENGVAKIQNFEGLGNVVVYDGEKNKWQKRQRLTFTCRVDSLLPIDSIQGCGIESYVEIDGAEYVLSEKWVPLKSAVDLGCDEPDLEGDAVDDVVDLDGDDALDSEDDETIDDGRYVLLRYLILDGEECVEFVGGDPDFPNEPSGVIKINEEKRLINTRFVNKANGGLLSVYLDNENIDLQLKTPYLIAERVSSYIDSYITNDRTNELIIDGVSYPTSVVEMINFDVEREVKKVEIEDNNELYYITLDDGTRVYFDKVEKDNEVWLTPTSAITNNYTDETNRYLVYLKQKVVVGDVAYYRNLYPINDSDNNNGIVITEPIQREGKKYTPCTIINKPIFENGYNDEEPSEDQATAQTAIENGFLIRRKPSYTLSIMEFKEPNQCICRVSSTDDNTSSVIANDIVLHQNDYVIKTNSITFANNKNDKFIQDWIDGDYGTEQMPSIAITQQRNNLSIPLQLSNMHGTNLHQEDLIKDKFVDKYAKNAINPIVDMEKDIYYPTRLTSDSSDSETLIDVTDVEFYIHLRTRDDDWNVNEDYYTNFNENYSVTEPVTGYTSSWNVFDYYENSEWTSDMQHYQPSDLLGFFDFNDIDIFYQKSKVGKSFLRLMLFDTPDPRNQSLLGTATIFLDSSTLFGKFSNKTNNPPTNIKYRNPKNNTISNYINVNSEPYAAATETYTFEEENRMSSKISVSDKLSSNKSAEGFYFYIFREYSYFLHERTIYLRIQFNHAGHGTVIDLMQPTSGNTLYEFNDENIDEFKKGIKAKELYDMMYIPIKVKYDLDSNKYCWYLPKDMVKHNEAKIKFNLYELKIQSL